MCSAYVFRHFGILVFPRYREGIRCVAQDEEKSKYNIDTIFNSCMVSSIVLSIH